MLGSIGSRVKKPFSPPGIGRWGKSMAEYSIRDAGSLIVLDSGGARENKIVCVRYVHPSLGE